MNSKDIFHALQSRKISPEDARRALLTIAQSGSEQQGAVDSTGSSEEQRCSLESFNHGNEHEEGNAGISGKERTTHGVVGLHEVEPGIVQLTMQDRAHKNTFSAELISGLKRSFGSIQANESYKAVILTGYDSYFASGGTKEELLAIQEGKMKFTDINIFSLALDCKIPVIAAMQGHGIGAGWSIGMFCDFIVMSRESIYTCNFMKYGFTPGAGATLIFPEKFGNNLAQEILFMGKQYRGSELEARGIPFPVLPRREVLPYAIQIARELSESPRESLVALKDLMAASVREKVSCTFEKELEMHEKTFVNQPEVRERIQSLFGGLSNSDVASKPYLNSQREINSAVHCGEVKKEGIPAEKKEGSESFLVNSMAQDEASRTSIAIIGMSGQFPKAKNVAAFWDNLAQGRDCISEIPPTRWSLDHYYDPDPKVPNKSYSKWMGVLEDADAFDPLFFNISPAEAELMDPQQRLFLENCWHCFEDSGLTPPALSESRCGVFVGCAANDYGQFLSEEELNAQSFMGGSPSFLAARISYFLNLKGPCLAIDTACSSSLVAIAEACNSLILHTSDLALAGGVYASAGPSLHIMTSKAGMLSKDGRCFTFDNRANGFVPGEGVGVVLLKRLADAARDQDPIYGVIKGWGTNQDGKTNGITAPSANSQMLLEKEVYQRFGINPETISLVEAHGTGTKLGDPIEVEALTASFRSFTQKKNYCAIGSSKSNIGHLLPAAGVAGLIKIVLALQHRMLPPTIHYETLNEHISLENSPFYANTRLRPWEVPNGTPRRACVSSFGLSGTNAHIVLEEYLPRIDAAQTPIPLSKKNPLLFVLSAKSNEQLKIYAEEMKDLIESHADLNLADMAYTLQVGRDAMDYRLAFSADSREALQKALASFIDNKPSAGVLTAQVKKSNDGEVAFDADEDANVLLQTWIQKKKHKKVAELWIKGLNIDWGQLYRDTKPRRISLPTYPFARERYWVPEIRGQESGVRSQGSENKGRTIHPLLHQNTSDFSEQRFSSTFTGREFFLSDHVVRGERILPGVAYLEMARAAVKQAAGALEEGQAGIRLKNVVWARPVAVGDQPVQVHIGLYPEDSGEIAYEIYSESEGNGAEPVVHSQGVAMLSSNSDVPALDVPGIQARCSQSSLRSSQCYDAFKAMGIEYGPAHQGIEEVYVGEGQVLAKLTLPSSLSDTQDQYVLHPSIMDSAVQASIGLLMGADDTTGKALLKPSIAFALQELEVFESCTSPMWALLRYSNVSKSRDMVQKLDIDLCDEQGKVRVRMKGFSTRVLEEEFQPSHAPETTSSETFGEPPVGPLMLIPVWDVVPVEKSQAFPSPTDHLVIVGGEEDTRKAIQQYYPKAHLLDIWSTDTIDALAQKLNVYGSIDHILWIAPAHSGASLAEDAVIEDQQQGVLHVFRMIKALLGLGYGSKAFGWSLITRQAQPINKNDTVNPTHASLHGLIGSMAKEYPDWNIRLVDLETDGDWPIADIFTLPPDPQGNAWVYRGQEWYRQNVIPLHRSHSDQTVYKVGGVYVVIGGAGGIGEAWSEYMIRTYQARIVWIGRRQKDAAIQAKVDRLSNLGPAPIYIAADAGDRKALQQAYDEIKRRYSPIHGVIHSAMVLLDQSLMDMDEERFQAGLSAKVDVSVRIAQVFHEEPLDFIAFFSSISSFLKVKRYSSYASACTFLDAFAHQLSHEWPGAVNVMNWGYWGSVGKVAASPDFQSWMGRNGIGSIEPSEAMEALETLLAGSLDQIALMKTTNPSGLEGMYPADELISVYPDNRCSTIQNMQNHLPEQGLETQRLKSALSMQSQLEEIDERLTGLLRSQLESMGLFAEKTPIIADLKTTLRDSYERWFEESLTMLARKNYLRHDGESCSVVDLNSIERDVLWKEWERKKAAWLKSPDTKAHVVLVEKMLRALPEILTGKLLATDIMFPNSSMELVEGIYNRNPVADYFNGALADRVVASIQERLQQDSSARIRIIEIGAGTGGASAGIFQKLKPYQEQIQEYCYTDISKAFLLHAEKEYGPENPYLTYAIFDVEAPIAGQGIDAGGYDIAIATNVLHATRNIRQTLRNAKAVLRKNGLLLASELSGNTVLNHLTFGLLEGWWLYEDQALRIPGCPGVSPQAWQKVLESEGFRSVSFPVREAHALGQQIIIAESDGVVRQKQQQKPNRTAVKEGVIPQAVPSPKKSDTAQWSITKDQPLARQKVKTVQRRTDAADHMVEEHVKKTIIEKLSVALKVDIDTIDADEPFADYGIDSILGVDLVQVINQALRLELETSILFDHSSVNQLTTYIHSQYKNLITETLGRSLSHGDNNPEMSSGTGERHPVCSYPSRFLRRRALRPEPYGRNNGDRAGELFGKDPIAIIGMAGQFPDAPDVNTLWQNVIEGHDAVHEFPSRYLDQGRYFSNEKQPGKTYSKWGGILKDRDCFDASFFNISPREAESMNPHQRLILQESWKALEDAGYNPKGLSDSLVGMFIGAEPTGYFHESFTGSSDAIVASRLSYYLNLNGPALVVNTGCSSSGVAIHLACESLHHEDSSIAIAGGVFANMGRTILVTLSEIEMLSPTGRCCTFDESADGTVLSEGVGVVVLKRLRDAIAAGDHIYGVIRGSGVNQDGASNGITAPSGSAQEALITGMYKRYGINPEEITYIEAHGTGTELGDPVEANALIRAFKQLTKKEQYCALGCAKPSLGHTAAAAGVVGLIKILLSMQHHTIPGLLHFKKVNPYINFTGSAFYVNTALSEWRAANNKPLMAALNSFGHSGTNVHLVIQEHIPSAEASFATPTLLNQRTPVLIPLSAKNKDRLRDCVGNLVKFLRNTPSPEAGRADNTSVSSKLQDALEQNITRMLAEILQVNKEEIEVEEGFQHYGVEHIHVTQLQKMLQDELDIEIQLKELFERRSIASIALYLIQHHPRSLESDNSALHQNSPMIQETKRESDGIPDSMVNLAAMAYTLQTGREAMEERIVFLVKDIPGLIEKLEAYREGKERISDCWHGHVKEGKNTARFFAADEDMQEAVEKWIAKGKLNNIAELWTEGVAINWELLYGERRPQRISLPTYPFARERYWAPEIRGQESENKGQTIHPLLHQNTSDLSEQRFSSIFSGEEFFLTDHVVKGNRVLPEVAYLEMARAAVELSAGDGEDGQTAIGLKNIVWARPVAAGDQPVRVHIGLYPEDSGAIAYEIYSESEGNGREPVVHSQGIAMLGSIADVPLLDLSGIQGQCCRRTVSSRQCYEAFRAMGIEYGPGHQGIEQVYLGEGQVLAKLTLPTSVSATQDQYVLHPSMLDSALQSSLLMRSGDCKLALPVALEELEVLDKCTSSMWALIRYREGCEAGDTVEKLDIDLCDEEGKVCVRMKGLTVQGGLETPIAPHALHVTTASEPTASERSDKPSGISLPSLSADQMLFSKPAEQTRQSITVPPTSISLLPSEVNDESKPVTAIEPDVSVESLQEDLTTSLAEALYMKRSDVDVDKKFTDMGLDSIVGVEWIRAINKQYGTSIKAPKIYDYLTIREFAGFLEKELHKQAGGLRSSNSRRALQLITETEPTFSDRSDRPSGISLLSLSDDQMLFSKPAEQTRQSITVPPTSISLLPSEVNDESKPVTAIEPDVSVESLQEDLTTSLAEALYMKRSDVDVDKKFTDMGLDSIVGVEWIRAINKQYGTSIKAPKIYDYLTIREFAGFLKKELPQQAEGLKRTPLKATPSISLDDVIQQVQQGTLDIERADQLLQQYHGEEK